MSTVEQIHHLEHRIDRLLATLRELRTANESLRGQLAVSEERAADLERTLADSESARQEADRRGEGLSQQLSQLHAEHEEIEATITRTLDQLGKLDIGAAAETADVAPPADSGPAAYADAPEDDGAADTEAGDPEQEAAPYDEPVQLSDDGDLSASDEAEAAEAEESGGNGRGDDLDIF